MKAGWIDGKSCRSTQLGSFTILLEAVQSKRNKNKMPEHRPGSKLSTDIKLK